MEGLKSSEQEAQDIVDAIPQSIAVPLVRDRHRLPNKSQAIVGT
jgi:hypothetical protein